MNEKERIDKLEAQVQLLKSVLKSLISEIRHSDIDLKKNEYGDITYARNDWDTSDLDELTRSLK